MLVWIVDDDPRFAAKFEKLLSDLSGIDKVQSFLSPEEVTEALQGLEARDFPGLIFLDVDLGAQTGLDLLPRFEALGVRVPIVLMSVGDRAKLVRDAGATRASSFLVKRGVDASTWNGWEREVEASVNFSLSRSAKLDELDAKQTTARLNLFYLSINHDYRQPIVDAAASLMKLSAALSRHSRSQPKSVVAAVREIDTALQTALETVAEIECVVGDGKIHVKPQPIALDQLRRRVREKWMTAFKSIEFELSCKARTLYLDRYKLHKIFDNVLQNSGKFKRGNAVLQIQVYEPSAAPDFIVFDIRDFGIGIPPREFERIWLAGVRGSNAATVEGFGRGLATVKMYVEAHHQIDTGKPGDCRFVIPDDAVGTRLIIQLPKKARQVLVDTSPLRVMPE